MLILNPRRVIFADQPWEQVTLVAIDRRAQRLALEWSDAGPHAVFADVPEQRVDLRVVMDVERDDIGGPAPGQLGELTLVTSPTASDARRRRLTVSAVVTAVSHEVSLRKGAVRTVELVAVSAGGADDPIAITEAGAQP
jgi:hypothetical protein